MTLSLCCFYKKDVSLDEIVYFISSENNILSYFFPLLFSCFSFSLDLYLFIFPAEGIVAIANAYLHVLKSTYVEIECKVNIWTYFIHQECIISFVM